MDQTGTIATVVGTGASCSAPCTTAAAGDGGPGTKATLNQPLAIAFDTQGNLYISDQFSQRVRRLAPDGTITTAAGNGDPGF